MTIDPLSQLPLFATDREIAIAVVGKERASMYVKSVIPVLERHGFPKVDHLHDGRPVPLVRRFYDGYFGITKGGQAPEVGLHEGTAIIPVGSRSADMKPTLNLDSRSETVLRYMIENPKARTHRDIRGVGEGTLQKVAAYGVIEASALDDRGDRIWKVTELGRDTIKRMDYWYYGKTT